MGEAANPTLIQHSHISQGNSTTMNQTHETRTWRRANYHERTPQILFRGIGAANTASRNTEHMKREKILGDKEYFIDVMPSSLGRRRKASFETTAT